MFFNSAFPFDPALGGSRAFDELAHALADEGVEVVCVCGGQVGLTFSKRRDAKGPRNLLELARMYGIRNQPVERRTPLTFRRRSVKYHIAHVRYRFESLAGVSAEALEAMLQVVNDVLQTFDPDLVFSICCSGRDALVHKLALCQGYPVGHLISTVDIIDPEAVRFANGIAGLSRYSIERFRDLLPLADKAQLAMHPRISQTPVARGRVPGEYVTFINPIEHKGLELFLRLVAQFARERPRLTFLVVESRGTASHVLDAAGVDLRKLPNVKIQRCTADMRRVYRRTRVLLVPSTWQEAYGMVVTEAQGFGIPVLASDRGGLPEALYGAAPALPALLGDASESEKARTQQIWAAALRRLLDDPRHFRAQRRAALRAFARYRRANASATVKRKFERFYRELVRSPLEAGCNQELAEFRRHFFLEG